MMQLLLQRVALQATYTQGYLFVDNQYFCDTLESRVFNPERDRKNARFVALPRGRYQVELHYSVRYKKFVPTIIPQKGKDYKFHRGSKPKDAKGIILGKNTRIGWIEDSSHIVSSFTKLVSKAIRRKENVILVIK